MEEKIEVAEVRTSYCRKTGELISTEVISTEERNKKEFYQPLIKLFGDLVEECEPKIKKQEKLQEA